MSRSQVVAEHLPLLRRYARALTGNQSSGDAYVAAMLEALLQDASLLDERHGPRAGLFRLFTQIWNSVSINDKSDVTPLPLPSERRLSNITPLPRQSFLLLSLEGFSEEEVAFILDKEIGETLAFWNVVPPAFGPSLHTATDSTRAIQWSASSCPEANAEITSNTWSEKPPMFRMSSRSTACVVWFGWTSRQTMRACGFRCRNSAHSASNAVPRPRP